jgi:hypothetical protein
MLQVVLFLIAIGITLFLWQVFPAFKWVVAVMVAVPIIWLTAELANDKIHQINVAKQETQEAYERAKQIQLDNQEKEKKRIASFERFDSLAKNQKNSFVNNENLYFSNYEKGFVVLTNRVCKMGDNTYKNLQESFLRMPEQKRIDSCWAYNEKTNNVILITHLENESFKNEISFQYFTPAVWDVEKQQFIEKK